MTTKLMLDLLQSQKRVIESMTEALITQPASQPAIDCQGGITQQIENLMQNFVRGSAETLCSLQRTERDIRERDRERTQSSKERGNSVIEGEIAVEEKPLS